MYKQKQYQTAFKEVFRYLDKRLNVKKVQIEVLQIANDLQSMLDKKADKKREKPRFTEPSVAGTTATIVLITNNKIVCANVGDSRTVYCKNGEAFALSNDHKPEDENETSRIEAAGSFVKNGRINGELAVARALGDREFKTSENLDAFE